MENVKTFFSTRAKKAWTGGVAAVVVVFWTAVGDGSISGDEIAKMAGAFVAGALAVFLVKNAR